VLAFGTTQGLETDLREETRHHGHPHGDIASNDAATKDPNLPFKATALAQTPSEVLNTDMLKIIVLP
jgi:hypothetical protein